MNATREAERGSVLRLEAGAERAQVRLVDGVGLVLGLALLVLADPSLTDGGCDDEFVLGRGWGLDSRDAAALAHLLLPLQKHALELLLYLVARPSPPVRHLSDALCPRLHRLALGLEEDADVALALDDEALRLYDLLRLAARHPKDAATTLKSCAWDTNNCKHPTEGPSMS